MMANILQLQMSVEEETSFQPEHSQLVTQRVSLPKIPADAEYCIARQPPLLAASPEELVSLSSLRPR